MGDPKHLYYVEWNEGGRRLAYGWVIATSEDDAVFRADDEAIDITREGQPSAGGDDPPAKAWLATSDDFDKLYSSLKAQKESLREDMDTIEINLIALEEVET
jgi:hypothetical protein